MKKLAVLLGMFMMAAPAQADITHRISSSVQLNVQSAATQATRLGNSFSTSGSGVNTDIGGGASADNKIGGFGTLSSGVASSPSLPTVHKPLQAKRSLTQFRLRKVMHLLPLVQR